jgi:sorbitol/mannitol transport system substrate-binding protein
LKKVDPAEKFIAWATGKEYIELVASKDGWANVPPTQGVQSML